MECSIIICTRNRARKLARTLEALQRLQVPTGWQVEILVVDNASTDDTAAMVQAFRSLFPVVYLHEPRITKSHALNTALRHARGEALLFTDDDALPAPGWLRKMAEPLLRRQCDAVSGHIELWPEIVQPWMGPMHRVWLAAPTLPGGVVGDLIGANMGLHRSVLARVPAYDPELGPGKLFGEDTLFARQLIKAGYRLVHLPEASVLHCPDPARLSRAYWLAEAEKRGRSLAYVLHHWEHGKVKLAGLRFLYLLLKLVVRRALTMLCRAEPGEVPAWELSYRMEMAVCRHFWQERVRPRNYTLRGLVKQRAPLPPREPAAASAPLKPLSACKN